MAEAKKTTKKTKADKAEIKKAEKLAAEETTDKLNELVETEAIAEAIVDAEKQIEAEEETATKATAKAGKRSAKAIKEDDEKAAKEAKKASKDTSEAKQAARPPVKPPRSKVERAGKKYQTAAKLIEVGKVYELNEALDLATKTSPTKFDASVELHINLGVDPTQADQNVRDTVVLPAGTGKDIRVVVLAEDSDPDKIFAKLDKETIDFDVLVATPTMMPKLGKYARLLGPRGLMPSPKSGTVTTNVDAAVKEAKAGKVEYRVDQAGIIHLSIGKVSFGPDKLSQNATVVLNSIKAAKPSSVKGIYIKSSYITTSMGPSIKFNV